MISIDMDDIVRRCLRIIDMLRLFHSTHALVVPHGLLFQERQATLQRSAPFHLTGLGAGQAPARETIKGLPQGLHCLDKKIQETPAASTGKSTETD